MNEQMVQGLMGLLTDVVNALRTLKEGMEALQKGQQILMEQLKEKPKTPKKSRKKKDAAAQESEEAVADKFGQLETAILEQMRADYGEDVARPRLVQQDESTFLINDQPVTNADMTRIQQAISSFDAATPADIASDLGLPVEAVYMVQILMQRYTPHE